MDKKHILVVDDDPAILKLLCTNLKTRGYSVSSAADGEDAIRIVEGEVVDLIILDIMMPRLDGVEVCRRVRGWSEVPIIVLSARGDENDKVRCLELGADDYLTKPFGIAELMARVKTALRRSNGFSTSASQASFHSGELEINFAMRHVAVGDREVNLTPTEFNVLQYLALNSDKVLTHSMILQSVWGGEYSSEREYLRVFIRRLRKKIEPNPREPRYLKTLPGVGYYLYTEKVLQSSVSL